MGKIWNNKTTTQNMDFNKFMNYGIWASKHAKIFDVHGLEDRFLTKQDISPEDAIKQKQEFMDAVQRGNNIHEMQKAIEGYAHTLRDFGFGRPMVYTVDENNQNYEVVFLPTDKSIDIPLNELPSLTINGNTGHGVSMVSGMPTMDAMVFVSGQNKEVGLVSSATAGIDFGNRKLNTPQIANYIKRQQDMLTRARAITNFTKQGVSAATYKNPVLMTKSQKDDLKSAWEISGRRERTAAIAGQANLSAYFKTLYNRYEDQIIRDSRLRKGGSPYDEASLYSRLSNLVGAARGYSNAQDFGEYVKKHDPWIHHNMWKGDLENLFKTMYGMGMVQGTKKEGVNDIVSFVDVPVPGSVLLPEGSNKIAKTLRIFQKPVSTNTKNSHANGINITTTKEQRQLYTPEEQKQYKHFQYMYNMAELTNEDIVAAGERKVRQLLGLSDNTKITPELFKKAMQKPGGEVLGNIFTGLESDSSIYAASLYKDFKAAPKQQKVISQHALYQALKEKVIPDYLRKKASAKDATQDDKDAVELFSLMSGEEQTAEIGNILASLGEKEGQDLLKAAAKRVLDLKDSKKTLTKLEKVQGEELEYIATIRDDLNSPTFKGVAGATGTHRRTLSMMTDELFGWALEHRGYKKEDIYKDVKKGAAGGLKVGIGIGPEEFSSKTFFNDFMETYQYLASTVAGGGNDLKKINPQKVVDFFKGTPFEGMVSVDDNGTGISFNDQRLKEIQDTFEGQHTNRGAAYMLQSMVNLGIQKGIYDEANRIIIDEATGMMSQKLPNLKASEFGRNDVAQYMGVDEDTNSRLKITSKELISLENTLGLMRKNLGPESAAVASMEEYINGLREAFGKKEAEYASYERNRKALDYTFKSDVEAARDEFKKFGAIINPEDYKNWETAVEYDTFGVGGVYGRRDQNAAALIEQARHKRYEELLQEYTEEQLHKAGIYSENDVQVALSTGKDKRYYYKDTRGDEHVGGLIVLGKGTVGDEIQIEGTDEYITKVDQTATKNMNLVRYAQDLQNVDDTNLYDARKIGGKINTATTEIVKATDNELYDQYHTLTSEDGGYMLATALNRNAIQLLGLEKEIDATYIRSIDDGRKMFSQLTDDKLRAIYKSQYGRDANKRWKHSRLVEEVLASYTMENANFKNKGDYSYLDWRSPTLKYLDDIVGGGTIFSNTVANGTFKVNPLHAKGIKLDFDGDMVALTRAFSGPGGSIEDWEQVNTDLGNYYSKLAQQQAELQKTVETDATKQGELDEVNRLMDKVTQMKTIAGANIGAKGAGIYGNFLIAMAHALEGEGISFSSIQGRDSNANIGFTGTIANSILGALYQEGINIKNTKANMGEPTDQVDALMFRIAQGSTWTSPEAMLRVLSEAEELNILGKGGTFKSNVAANLGFTNQRPLYEGEYEYLRKMADAAREAAVARDDQDAIARIDATIQQLTEKSNQIDVGKEILAQIIAGEGEDTLKAFLGAKGANMGTIVQNQRKYLPGNNGRYYAQGLGVMDEWTQRRAAHWNIGAAQVVDKDTAYETPAERYKHMEEIATKENPYYTTASKIKGQMVPHEGPSIAPLTRKGEEYIKKALAAEGEDATKIAQDFERFAKNNPDVMHLMEANLRGTMIHVMQEAILGLDDGDYKNDPEYKQAEEKLTKFYALRGFNPKDINARMENAARMAEAQKTQVSRLLNQEGNRVLNTQTGQRAQVIATEAPLLGFMGNNGMSYDITDMIYKTINDETGKATLHVLDYKNRGAEGLSMGDIVQELQYYNDLEDLRSVIFSNANGITGIPAATEFLDSDNPIAKQWKERLDKQAENEIDAANKRRKKAGQGVLTPKEEAEIRNKQYQKFEGIYDTLQMGGEEGELGFALETAIANPYGGTQIVKFTPNYTFKRLASRIKADPNAQIDEDEAAYLMSNTEIIDRDRFDSALPMSPEAKFKQLYQRNRTQHTIQSGFDELYNTEYKIWELEQKMAQPGNKKNLPFLEAQKNDLTEMRDLAQAYVDTLKEAHSNAEGSKMLQDAEKRSKTQLDLRRNQFLVANAGATTKQGVFGGIESGVGKLLGRFFTGYGLQRVFSKIIQSIAKLVAEATALDQAMVNLRIVTGDNKEDTKLLINEYANLGKTIGATTTEVANSAVGWLRQGYETAEVLDLVKSSMYLSKLGMMDAATATQSLTSALKGFKLEANESMDIVDKLTAIDLKAATSAGEIAQGLAQFANVGSLMGVDINQAAAYVATISDVTQMSGSSAGQALKTIISRYGNVKAGAYNKLNVQAEGSDESVKLNDVERVLSKLGISIRDTNLKFKDFDVILNEIAEQWGNLDTVSQKAIATAFAGVRQQEAFVTLLQNWNKYEELEETAENSKGTAEKKYTAYEEGIQASKASLTAALQEFVNKGEIAEVIKRFLDLLTKIAEDLPKIIYIATQLFTQIQNVKALSGNSLVQKGLNRIWNGGERFYKGGLSKYFTGFGGKDHLQRFEGVYDSFFGTPTSGSILGRGRSHRQMHPFKEKTMAAFTQDRSMYLSGNLTDSEKQALVDKWGKDKNGKNRIDLSEKQMGKQLDSLFRNMTEEARKQLQLTQQKTEEEQKALTAAQQGTEAEKEATIQDQQQAALEQQQTMQDQQQAALEQQQTMQDQQQTIQEQSQTMQDQMQLVNEQSQTIQDTMQKTVGSGGGGGGSMGGSIAGMIASMAINQGVAALSAYQSNGLTHKNERGEEVQSSKEARKEGGKMAAAMAAIPFVGGALAKLVADDRSAEVDKQRDHLKVIEADANHMLKLISSIDGNLKTISENIDLNDADAAKEAAQEIITTIFGGQEEADKSFRTDLGNALINIGAIKNHSELLDFLEKLGSSDREERKAAYVQYKQASASVASQVEANSLLYNGYELEQEMRDLKNDRKTLDSVKRYQESLEYQHYIETYAGAEAASLTKYHKQYEHTLDYLLETFEQYNGDELIDKVNQALNDVYRNTGTTDAYTYIGKNSHNDYDFIDDQQYIVDKLNEVKNLALEQLRTETYQNKLINEKAVEEALANSYIDGQSVLLMNQQQLGLYKTSDLYKEVAKHLSDTDFTKPVYNSLGELTDEAVKAIETVLKNNDEIASFLSHEEKTFKVLLQQLDAKDQFDQKTLSTIASALGVSTDYLIKNRDALSNIFSELTIHDFTLSTSELIEKQTAYKDLLEKIGDATGSVSSWMETIISQFPELIGYMNNVSELSQKILLKMRQLTYVELNSQWESIARSKDIYQDLIGEGKFNTTKADTGFTTFGDIFKSGKYTEDQIKAMKEIINSNNFGNLYELIDFMQTTGYGLAGAQELIEVIYQVGDGIDIVADTYKTLISTWTDYNSKVLDQQITNLQEQEEALKNINTQREYENKLIEAKLRLENALTEKKMVYRAGIGFVYESDQASIKEAQEEIENLSVEKQSSELEQEILSLQTQKEKIDTLLEQQSFEELEKINQSFEEEFLPAFQGAFTSEGGQNSLYNKIGLISALAPGIGQDFQKWTQQGMAAIVENIKASELLTVDVDGNSIKIDATTDNPVPVIDVSRIDDVAQTELDKYREQLDKIKDIIVDQNSDLEVRYTAIDDYINVYKELIKKFGDSDLIPEDIKEDFKKISAVTERAKDIRTGYSLNNATNTSTFRLSAWDTTEHGALDANQMSKWIAGDAADSAKGINKILEKTTEFGIWTSLDSSPQNIAHYVSGATKGDVEDFTDVESLLKYILMNADSNITDLYDDDGNFEIVFGGTNGNDEFVLLTGNKNNLANIQKTFLHLDSDDTTGLNEEHRWRNDIELEKQINNLFAAEIKKIQDDLSVETLKDELAERKRASGGKAAKFASGTIDSGNTIAKINELGTEAIITPSGVLTALPSHSGIVPADITKNLWALGEVAPEILRVISPSLQPDYIGNHSSDNIVDESLNIATLTMNITADDSFDADAFVESIKNRADLTKNIRR